MQLAFRPEAWQELLDAQAWYESRAVGLGFEFARAVDAALSRVTRMPMALPRIEAEFPHVVMRKVPCSILCHAAESKLVVVSCFHHRRKSGNWLSNA